MERGDGQGILFAALIAMKQKSYNLSKAAAVHMPLTDKGFLLHGHLGTVMGNGYDNATMPRFTYGYGANGQAAYVRDSELNRTVWTEYDTSERPMRVHVLEGATRTISCLTP